MRRVPLGQLGKGVNDSLALGKEAFVSALGKEASTEEEEEDALSQSPVFLLRRVPLGHFSFLTGEGIFGLTITFSSATGFSTTFSATLSETGFSATLSETGFSATGFSATGLSATGFSTTFSATLSATGLSATLSETGFSATFSATLSATGFSATLASVTLASETFGLIASIMRGSITILYLSNTFRL